MYKKCLSLLLVIVLLTGFFYSCKHTQTSCDQSFREFTDALFCQEVSSNSITLHYTLRHPQNRNIHSDPCTFGNFETNTGVLYTILENYQSALSQFSYEKLSRENQITYDILSDYFTQLKKGTSYALYAEPLAPLTGIQAQLPVLMSEYPLQNEDDLEHYLALLATTGEYFDSLIFFEKQKADTGLFLSQATADTLLSECQSFIAHTSDNYLITTFGKRVQNISTLSPQKQAIYLKKNKSIVRENVIPAYQHLISFLKEYKNRGKNENGLYYLPKGKRYYQYLVRQQTGSARTIREIQTMVSRQIASDKNAIANVLATKNGQRQAAQISDTQNTTLQSLSPKSIVSRLKKEIDAHFPSIPEVTLSIKDVPSDLEPYLSPAFYMIPPIDERQENTIYINHSSCPAGISLYTTLAHEGYPGHLYQTTFFQSQNPDPLRSILDYGGYVEGWATYAEMISYYLSPLSQEQSVLLQKNASLNLGLYALADMGIHYEGWTLLDTLSFFREYGITDLKTIQEIYGLIVADPGNYLKYYLGYLEFLELKKSAIKSMGTEFSQKAFHQSVLEVGPAPFAIVQKYMKSENRSSSAR